MGSVDLISKSQGQSHLLTVHKISLAQQTPSG